ncbi:MAG: hypothetical protein XD36_3293 [Halomonas sp. 54_146]|nr:MAG: hypothetical protein XD36_3293 [Halomonas sp. 54_146]
MPRLYPLPSRYATQEEVLRAFWISVSVHLYPAEVVSGIVIKKGSSATGWRVFYYGYQGFTGWATKVVVSLKAKFKRSLDSAGRSR